MIGKVSGGDFGLAKLLALKVVKFLIDEMKKKTLNSSRKIRSVKLTKLKRVN